MHPYTTHFVEQAGAALRLDAGSRPLRAPLIQLRDLVKVYETEAGDVAALKGVQAEFEAGEFVVIVGKSGAGKSTLVNMLTGVDRLTSGEVLIGGVSVQTLGESEKALWRGLNLGIVYQSFELLPQLSLLDNVMLPMDLCGLYHPRRSPRRARELLDRVGLADHAHKPPTDISGGQRQRVAIARALANDPPIMVADEPTGSLDSATAAEILALFEELVAQGKTLVMVTHDHSLAQHATRIVQLADGRIVSQMRADARALEEIADGGEPVRNTQDQDASRCNGRISG
ncbi:MAG: ABC transporter ATP-binding protein [Anaerolineae bacterium]|nr:ABC transporter ATP-binding protein [Anaerolineae bacterium]